MKKKISTFLKPLFVAQKPKKDILKLLFMESMTGNLEGGELGIGDLPDLVDKHCADLGYMPSDEDLTKLAITTMKGLKIIPCTYAGVILLASEVTEKLYTEKDYFLSFLKANWKGVFPKKGQGEFSVDQHYGRIYHMLMEKGLMSIEDTNSGFKELQKQKKMYDSYLSDIFKHVRASKALINKFGIAEFNKFGDH